MSGNALDAAHKPIGFATVMLLQAKDSTLVRGVFTTENGQFLFENVPNGTFLINISMLGYTAAFSASIHLNADATDAALPPIVLQEKTAVLGEVQVKERRPFLEQKIDRTVVNVANSITNAGGSALQVLERSPGVQVNALTKTISLAGKQGVVLMINNKISRMPADAVTDMLAGMNADNIDRIELIHTPPAGFEAEGNAGIIHIVLKSTGEEGLNGGYSAKAGYGFDRKYGFGAYFNHRKDRVNLFGSYDLDHNINPQVFTNYRRVQAGNDLLETESYSDRPYTPTTTQNARLGADFQVSKKTVIGVLGAFFDRNWYMEAVNDVQYRKNGVVDSLLRMPNTETNHNRSFGANVNLSHQFSASQSLNFDADWVQYDMRNPSHYTLQNMDADETPTSQNELRIDKITPIRVAVAKADYNRNFGKNAKLETGLKWTSMRFNNDVRVEERQAQGDWNIIPMYTSMSRLNERIGAAYASFSAKLSEKTDIKAGLRYEHTDTKLDSGEQVIVVDRNYGSWFPSVFVGRKISKKQSLNLAYSRRITRPTIRNLAPWLIFADPTTLQGGNPALQPSFTDAFSLNYILKSYRLGLSYSIENQAIRGVPTVDKKRNIQFSAPVNLDRIQTLNANIFLPLHPTSWWDISGNYFANFIQTDFVLEGKTLQINNLSYGFNLQNSIKLPRRLTVEVTGNYDSPSVWGVAYWRATGSLNVGLEKNMGDKWGKLRLNGNNLFASTNWFGTTDQPDIGLYVRSSFQFAERVFMISWSNTFGKQKLKPARQRQTGAAEEMRRI